MMLFKADLKSVGGPGAYQNPSPPTHLPSSIQWTQSICSVCRFP